MQLYPSALEIHKVPANSRILSDMSWSHGQNNIASISGNRTSWVPKGYGSL